MLRGVDNIGVARNGDLMVAEDGGNMELALISFDLVVSPLLQVVGEPTSEIAGPAFDPRFRHLYFASQRGGPLGLGTIYQITGPFLRKRRRRRKSRRGRNDLHIP